MSKKGFGTQSPSFAGLFKMKIEDQTNPIFQELTKEGDKWVVSATAQDLTFDLLNMSFGNYEYRGDKVDKLIMEINIGWEAPCKLEMNLSNGIAQSIINTLSNVEQLPGSEIMMRVYTSNSGHASVYIEIDGERGSWKFDGSTVSKIYGKPERWIDMAKKYILPQFEDVFDRAAAEEMQEPQRTEKPVKKSEPAPVEDDDLPF